MDWKAGALAEVRRARSRVNNLCHSVIDLHYILRNLEGYEDECISMMDVVETINGITKDLFELEGELSRTK